jgi:hypothetical protein
MARPAKLARACALLLAATSCVAGFDVVKVEDSGSGSGSSGSSLSELEPPAGEDGVDNVVNKDKAHLVDVQGGESGMYSKGPNATAPVADPMTKRSGRSKEAHAENKVLLAKIQAFKPKAEAEGRKNRLQLKAAALAKKEAADAAAAKVEGQARAQMEGYKAEVDALIANATVAALDVEASKPTPADTTEQALQKAATDVVSAEKLVFNTRTRIDDAQNAISVAAAAQDYDKAANLKKSKEKSVAQLSKAQAKLAMAKAHLGDAQQAHRKMKLGDGVPFAGSAAKESVSSYSAMIQAPLWKWKDKIDAAVAVVSTAISHAAAHGSVNIAVTDAARPAVTCEHCNGQRGVCWLGKCYCNPGLSGDDCSRLSFESFEKVKRKFTEPIGSGSADASAPTSAAVLVDLGLGGKNVFRIGKEWNSTNSKVTRSPIGEGWKSTNSKAIKYVDTDPLPSPDVDLAAPVDDFDDGDVSMLTDVLRDSFAGVVLQWILLSKGYATTCLPPSKYLQANGKNENAHGQLLVDFSNSLLPDADQAGGGSVPRPKQAKSTDGENPNKSGLTSLFNSVAEEGSSLFNKGKSFLHTLESTAKSVVVEAEAAYASSAHSGWMQNKELAAFMRGMPRRRASQPLSAIPGVSQRYSAFPSRWVPDGRTLFDQGDSLVRDVGNPNAVFRIKD